MAQYSTPSADLHDGNWLDEGGSAVDIYLSVVPGTPGSIGAGDDSTYAESDLAPSSSPVAWDGSTIEDPVSSSGHVLRWRRQKDASGGAQIDLTVQLRQGYVSEGTPGTQIHSASDADIPAAFGTTSSTLSAGEADSITDYSDLQFRVVANQV